MKKKGGEGVRMFVVSPGLVLSAAGFGRLAAGLGHERSESTEEWPAQDASCRPVSQHKDAAKKETGNQKTHDCVHQYGCCCCLSVGREKNIDQNTEG